MTLDLETRFHGRMLEIYRRAAAECDYHASYFLQMVQEHGGFETAQRLLYSQKISDGFTRLWEAGRLDLSVEAVVLQQPWCDLFTEEELGIARRRLRQMGYRTGSEPY